MARARAANSSDPDLCHSSNLTPPWERENIAQVPYLDAASPSLSNAERAALPSLWAVQTNNTPSARPKAESHTRYGSNTSLRRGQSADDCINPWAVKAPLTAPPPPRPYDTPIYIPPAPKSTPYPPTFTRPPPTPPDSDMASCATTSASGSPHARQEEKPLPNLPAAAVPAAASGRRDSPRKASSTRGSRKPGSRLQRWKSALKEMFTHQPSDERDLVHIHAQGHWTDD